MLTVPLKFAEGYTAFHIKPSELSSSSSVLQHSVWHVEGDKLYDQGRYKESIACYECALVHKSDEYLAWNKLGLAQSALQQHQQAISSFTQAIEINPEIYVAWYNKGNALREL